MKHWTTRVALAVGLVGAWSVAGEFGMATSALAATSTMRSGPVYINGHMWKNVPYVVANNTTFFGIWYLQQLLSSYGIASQWDGRTLSIQGVPRIQGTATYTVGGQQKSSSILTWNGATYVDVSTLAAAGSGQLQYSSSTNTLAVNWPTSQNDVAPVVRISPSGNASSASAPRLSTTRPASSAVSMSTGYVREAGTLWKSVPILRRDGTTFFGVWYLQQFLSQHGIQASWNGVSLSIQQFPQIVSGAKLTLAGRAASTSLIQWANAWYAPVSALQAAGMTVVTNGTQSVTATLPTPTASTVQGEILDANNQPVAGKVAIEDALGLVHVVDTDASGQFVTQLSGGGYLIGAETANDGWVSQALALAGGSPLTATTVQRMSQIQGTLQFSGTPYGISQVSVRNVITHAHYYATPTANHTFQLTVPAGAYEVYAVVPSGSQDVLYLLQPFVTTGDITQLSVSVPALPKAKSVQTAHAVVSAADSEVTAGDLQSVANLFEHIYPLDVNRTGLAPSQKMNIVLYGTADDYKQHFIQEGYSSDEAQQIADQSIATEEGTNTISVLLPSYDLTDGLNILAHEFTHALIATVSNQIQSWANEGVAWTDGIAGELDGSPDEVLQQGLQWYEWVDIVAHQQQGDLLPLGGADPLSGDYNVEDQDYFAVQQLIDQFGMDKFMQYVKAIDTNPNAFAQTFGETFDQFSQSVTAKLQALASQANTTFSMRIRVLPNGPSQIYVINPFGKTVTITGLKPGQSYTLQCHSDGTVTAPTGLSVAPGTSLPIVYGGDWYVGAGMGGSLPRQEFEVAYEYGRPFLVQALLYGSDGSLEHAYPATAVPDGVQLTGLTG
ncbi:hypothetical protein GCM10025857_26370 [Alicyclobacillus contaminans]|uniref:hypothetical protein n=1 Tax=Alicyclobacillus contaminans TaxID=392016 RepID=UPI0004139F5A|nr:hypothetical protein [Alicyclobacillus contaminans]GMA51280.1 hypothetical protein GCM10025857_26370 [Alicyclobacillus contaminans]